METKINDEASGDATALRRRRRMATAIKQTMREFNNQISLLNHQVGSRVKLRDVDLDSLDVIAMHGPLSPSELARRAGLHPATITGILDRLEKQGWIVRERDDADRRAVQVRALPDRAGELFRLYSGMNGQVDEILADYDEAELAVLAGFLERATAAGRVATAELG